MKIYLAGKIAKNDWRHDIVGPMLRGADGGGDWTAERIRFGKHIYTGPFFSGCDHGCVHGRSPHAVSSDPCSIGERSPDADIARGTSGDFNPERAMLIYKCKMAILESDLVFAWVDDPTAFGTVWELGYAAGANVETCVGMPTTFDGSDLWFPVYGADGVFRAGSPKDALEKRLAITKDLSESPIESKMLTAFHALEPRTVAIEQQHETCGFRLDFALFAPRRKVAVECDGHDFHEKTKEQARRDKRRDRTLTEAGWTVLRFTGSEIHADALACARQALRVATQQQQHDGVALV